MTLLLAAALSLGLLAAAWSAGFFWSWSFTVMPGFAAARPEAAAEAMRAVNANITGPFFAFVFFGPGLLAAVAALLAFATGRGATASWALAAAVVYGAGVIGVTVAANLPLNAALAAAPPAADPAEVWGAFAGPWTAWNHLRTAAASLAFAALAVAGAQAVRA